jgi:hypothetical protein
MSVNDLPRLCYVGAVDVKSFSLTNVDKFITVDD